MQLLLHTIKDLIVAFVTIQWEKLYAYKVYYLRQQMEEGQYLHINAPYFSPPSFFKLQHWQQYD